jgi:hypothetical protein
MCIDKTLMSILRFFQPFFLSFVLVLPFLGSLLVLPGPHPRVYPNSKASDISHRETQWCHLNGTLMVVVACKLDQWTRTIPNVYVGPTHTYATQPSKFGSFLRSTCLSQGHVVLKFSGVPKASWETSPKSSCKHRFPYRI